MAKISGGYTIPDEHVAMIGRIADAWAQLEFQIDLGIWELANIEQQLGACITSQMMSVHPRMRAFTALVTIRGGSQKSVDDLNSFTGHISGLADKRNRAVHDPRYKDRRTEVIHRLEITAKPRVQFGFLPETRGDLVKIFDDISDKVAEFQAIRARVISEIEAIPAESQPIFHRITPVRKST